MKPTIKDIKAATGLSLSTISKYMNGGSVRKENKRLIDAAVTGLGYKANPFARSLKTHRSYTVGVIIPEFTSIFNTTIVAYIEELLRFKNYAIMISSSNLDRETESKAVEFLMGKQVDGIIAIPCDGTGESLAPARREGIPIVLLDRYILDGMDTVILDNTAAVRQAMQELLDKGHRRIGLISGTNSVYTMRMRREGYEKALAENGVASDPEIVAVGGLSTASGWEGMARLLDARRPPTGILCTSYELTLGAVMAVNERGLRIGEEISLIGFDNLELARVVSPRLTVVMQPLREMTQKAVSLLLRRLEGEAAGPPALFMLQAELIKGESVKTCGQRE